MVVKMMLCILVYRLKVIICYLKLFVSWLLRKLCILPMVYLLYNHCIFFLHLQIGVIIKIKLSIVTIIPLGQDRSKSDLVWSWLKVPPKIWHLDKINQSFHPSFQREIIYDVFHQPVPFVNLESNVWNKYPHCNFLN